MKYPIGTLVEVKYEAWHGDGACTKTHARLFVAAHCDGLYHLADLPITKWELVKPYDVFVKQSVMQVIMARGIYGLVLNISEDMLTPVPITTALIRGEGCLTWEE